MPQEIELKLSVPQQHASRVWQVLAHYRHDKPITRRLFSRYYDTPRHTFKEAGVGLRLRRQNGRWIQTVKFGGHVTGGLHQRAEYEADVGAPLPSFPAMAKAGLGDLIADGAVRESLTVVFTTEFSRTSALVQTGAGKAIEVCLDRGAITAGGRREVFCEIELESKSGGTQALFDLAIEIAQRLPVRLENRSKAQRGYALAVSEKPAPVRAQPCPLTPDMAVGEAFVAIALQCIAHLQANEQGLLELHDPEYLHQARVALRRLRSAFRVFAAVAPKTRFASLLEELKTLGQTLGAARDWDVFVTGIMARAHTTAHPGLAALKRRAQLARRRNRQAARAMVAAPEYTVLLLRLTARISAADWRHNETPQDASTLPQFAAGVLSHQLARLKKRGRRLAQLAFADLHRLRIEVKRFRYAGEFFLSLAPKKARERLRVLAQLQDLLGRLNDDASAWRLLDALAAENLSAEYQQAVGYVRGLCAADGSHCSSQLRAAWARFTQARLWWEQV